MARRSTVGRHASALGRWEMVRAAPHPALRGQVQEYCGYREETPAPLSRSETPSGTVTLVLSFGDEISV